MMDPADTGRSVDAASARGNTNAPIKKKRGPVAAAHREAVI
jgi:hypothetical protein